jgi:RHS repeat-associated protein
MDVRFTGQWFQLESGLAYNWHRHYDATLGRYLQPGKDLNFDGPNAGLNYGNGRVCQIRYKKNNRYSV